MRSKIRIARALSVLLFVFGVLFGVALSAGVIWGDLEASMFDASIGGEAPLKTLKCPVMMTTRELGMVSADFTNSLERPVEFRVRTHISEGYITLMREINTKLPLEPGETQSLKWAVSPDDAAFGGRLILLRVRLFPKYPLPSRHASCGILVMDLPYLTGNQFFTLALAASLLSMAGGAGLWFIANRPLKKSGRDVLRAMGALAGCVLAVTVASLLGHWFLSVFIFVITLLLIGAIVGYFLQAFSATHVLFRRAHPLSPLRSSGKRG